jgi:hypothetical protein
MSLYIYRLYIVVVRSVTIIYIDPRLSGPFLDTFRWRSPRDVSILFGQQPVGRGSIIYLDTQHKVSIQIYPVPHGAGYR